MYTTFILDLHALLGSRPPGKKNAGCREGKRWEAEGEFRILFSRSFDRAAHQAIPQDCVTKCVGLVAAELRPEEKWGRTKKREA